MARPVQEVSLSKSDRLEKRLFSFLAMLALPIVRILSSTVKFEKTLWVFGMQTPVGIDELKDNSKYLFLDLCSRHKGTVRPVWISWSKELAVKLRNNGYEAYHAVSLAGILLALKAGCDFSSEGFTRKRKMLVGAGRALSIDLWHGIPLKRLKECDNADYAIATSESTRELFGACLGVHPSKILVCGYPRNDILFREIKGYDLGIEDLVKHARALAKAGRIIVYAPTYRDYLKEVTVEEFFGHISFDPDRLHGILEAHDACLVIKPHYYVGPGKTRKRLDAISDRIHLINDPVDFYPILRLADVLITDYSSIHFDFLLLDRPIIFYIPDYAEYERTRGFCLDYDSMTPGPKARSFDELMPLLENVLEGKDTYGISRKRVREKLFQDCDGDSSERVFRQVMSILNLPVGED